MSTIRFICALALPAGMLLASLNGAGAQDSEAARKACTPDAMRLCKEFVPDQAKVRSCMLSKQSELSEVCRLAMAAKPVESARSEPRRPQYYYRTRYRPYYGCCGC